MRAVFKRGIVTAVLLIASAYCFLGAWATADLSPYGDLTAARRIYTWLGGCLVFGVSGLWQLVVLLKRHGSENLL
jgi:hypothetical protein